MFSSYVLRIGSIILATLVGTALIAHGQEAAPPSVDLYSGQNQPEAAATPSSEPNGPELPEISQLDQTFSKPKSLGKDADELRLHTEWRQLKNRTVNDPAVQAAKAAVLGSAGSITFDWREILSPLISTVKMTPTERSPQARIVSELCSPRALAMVPLAVVPTFVRVR